MNKEKKVVVKAYSEYTSEQEPMHHIEFDGAEYDVIGAEITKRESEIFKAAVYAERERLWDLAAGLVDDKIMSKLLNHDLHECKHCGWTGYLCEITDANSTIIGNNLKSYPHDLNCPNCKKFILSMG